MPRTPGCPRRWALAAWLLAPGCFDPTHAPARSGDASSSTADTGSGDTSGATHAPATDGGSTTGESGPQGDASSSSTIASGDDDGSSGEGTTGARLGCGDGSFDPGSPPFANVDSIAAPTPIAEIALVDLDGDGIDEAIVAGADAAMPGIYRITNLAGVAQAELLPGSDDELSTALVVAAIADGIPDVVTLVPAQNVARRWSGLGGGVFTAPEDFVGSSELAEIALADVDADGAAELLAPQPFAGLWVWHGSADETFAAPTAVNGNVCCELATGDVDEDGSDDVLVGSGYGVQLMLANGNGGFAAPFAWLPLTDGNYPVGALALADVDGDLHLDVLIAGDQLISIYPGDGAGGLRARIELAADGDVVVLAAEDLDGDGCDDIVAATAAGDVELRMSTGEGAFADAHSYAIATGADIADIELGDVDGDAVLDIVVAAPELADGAALVLRSSP